MDFGRSITGVLEALTDEQVAEQLFRRARFGGDQLSRRWLERMLASKYDPAARLKLVTEACDGVKEVRLAMVPLADPASGRAQFVYSYMEQPPEQDLVALEVLRILNAGLDAKLRRCLREQCRIPFFADPRAKWCSSTACGSTYRTGKSRAKRKKERSL